MTTTRKQAAPTPIRFPAALLEQIEARAQEQSVTRHAFIVNALWMAVRDSQEVPQQVSIPTVTPPKVQNQPQTGPAEQRAEVTTHFKGG